MPKNEMLAWFDPQARPMPDELLERLQDLANRWVGKVGKEQQLAQPFLDDLCRALGTARPTDGALPHEAYQYEKVVRVLDTSRIGRIDLYKRDHFVLEAKCGANDRSEGSAPVRGTAAYATYIENAYSQQARLYAASLPEGRPPLLIVVDVGDYFWIWRRDALGQYPGFHGPQRISFPLAAIAVEENARVLWLAFEDPAALDPSRYQERVTAEAARLIADVAAPLQARHEPAVVARFLIQCLFCMFAEDVDLLPSGHFTKLLQRGRGKPELFPRMIADLFQAMRDGGVADWEQIRRFNGALFAEAQPVALTHAELDRLADAASRNWALVEPSIFGTLIERALDPEKRRQLGAHYTPRAFVERLVRPVVEEPLRREWELAVKPEATRLWTEAAEMEPEGRAAKARRREALQLLDGFRHRLASVTVLDPACGTGNFLYVAYDVLKTLEFEVTSLRDTWAPDDAGRQEHLAVGEAAIGAVSPNQLRGIEVDGFAANIAQLVLWIGHLQWELRYRRSADDMPEPIIPTVRTIEARDALITWRERTPRTDSAGRPLTRWKMGAVKPATTHGGFVPDETVREALYDYEGVTPAAWPEVDFIVGNPPFIGNKVMRERLGDGYVDAVRGAYEVPETADFVMFWWHRAAEAARKGKVRRFGFITTNSLSQTFNRKVLEPHVSAKDAPLRLIFAVPDHPWHDDALGAAVRISMTAASAVPTGAVDGAVLTEVVAEGPTLAHLRLLTRRVPTIHPDLTAGVDMTSTRPLRANASISFQGMNLVGKGFRLSRDEVRGLGFDPEVLPPVIKPYLNAKEMMQVRQDRFVIDAYGLSAEDLREQYPTCYQWLLDRVKPEREQNNRESRRKNWWLFGEPVGKLRSAWEGLDRFLITPRVSKHRAFASVDQGTIPDCKLVAVCLDEDWQLGVLDSTLHSRFAVTSGGFLGAGNDPVYDNGLCLLPFPFPDVSAAQKVAIGRLASRLHRHRDAAQGRSEALTLTKIYNLVASRRANEKLSPKDAALHALLATDVLIDLHDALDAAVAEAYGWSWPLEEQDFLARLVALNHDRAAEEARGHVRWLRSERAGAPEPALPGLDEAESDVEQAADALPWPRDPGLQTMQVFALIDAAPAPVHVSALIARFAAKRIGRRIEEIASQLVAMGFAVRTESGAVRRSHA